MTVRCPPGLLGAAKLLFALRGATITVDPTLPADELRVADAPGIPAVWRVVMPPPRAA